MGLLAQRSQFWSELSRYKLKLKKKLMAGGGKSMAGINLHISPKSSSSAETNSEWTCPSQPVRHTGHPRCCCGGRGECCFQPCLQSFSSLATLAVLYTLCSWQKGRQDRVFLPLPPPSSTCSSFTMSRFCHYNKPHFWGLVFWVRGFFCVWGQGEIFSVY